MDNISDHELRARLIARGLNPPPVTDTSRALLLKKLKKLESGQQQPAVAAAATTTTTQAAVAGISNSHVDQHDGGAKSAAARRTRQSERKRDSSPELLPSDAAYGGASDSSPSPPRATRNARKEAVAERVDSMVSRIKNSTPYADANFAKGGGGGGGGGDPFERGSDSDDSLYSSRANSRYLVRKPLGMRRESEYYSAPTAAASAAAYRKYDSLNGASSYKGVTLGRYSKLGPNVSYGKSGGGGTSAKFSWKFVTPTTVLAACLVFFVVVGGIYYSKNDRSYGELAVADIIERPLCGVRASRPGSLCVPDKEMPSTVDYLQLLYRALYRRKLNAICRGVGAGAATSGGGRMSHDEVVELLALEAGLLHFECQKAIENMKTMAAANPQLRVTWSDADGFDIDDPPLPWSCTLRIWSGWLWDYLLYLGATVALLCSMHPLVRWVLTRHQAQAKEKQELIKSALEILQQNAATNPSQPYLPVVHVRDQLIAFADRNRKRKMWLEAVRYVEENESRVRKEVQPFEGEDYDVWRWVGGHQMSAPKPKTWQGEAFETSKDTMNTPSTSPTPCLKIRHMFDPKNEAADEDWGTGVKDAILERCEGVNIVHMVVDETSAEGCVYIKCASTDDAGKAYRKIHGAWFDGKIVTVKYLRLERYHERFPASVGLTKPLIPSNDQKRSLA